ncbi:MAG: hypothetical protein IH996_08885 [Proteobacteria bacterium]|nr:hypothetical protein [Pseudomonadota bacterium]
MRSDFLESLPELMKDVLGPPRFYLHQIDQTAEKGLVVEADREFYRRAIFLDQRALSEQTNGAWMPLEGLKQQVLAVQDPPAKTHFIFHIGHCGSTLMSRLLEAAGGNLALREPLVLRTLSELLQAADAGAGPLKANVVAREIEFHARLLGRTFEAAEVAIIKATSFTSNLGPALLALNPANRAVLMAMSAEAYVATMLGAAEYSADLRGFAAARYQTLAAHLGAPDFELSELSLGRLAGLAWLSELIKLQAIAAGAPGQSHFLDFDAFLAEPRSSLDELCSFLSLPLDDQALDRLMESPVLSQYSKAPDHPFDAAARRQRIAAAKASVGSDIEVALAFIAELSGAHPGLAEAAAHFGYA